MPRMLIVDKRYHYIHQGKNGFCKLRIFQDRQQDELRTVLLSEIEGNPGPAIVNCFEALATEISKQYGLMAAHTTFVDHYPPHNSFAEVLMTWDGKKYVSGQWRRLNETEVLYYLPREVSAHERRREVRA